MNHATAPSCMAHRSKMDRPHQQGVVLLVALIVMAVIAITSAAALKSASTQDLIGSNLRSRSTALQAAEAALRFCEAMVTTPSPTAAQTKLKLHIQPATSRNYVGKDGKAPLLKWETVKNWVIDTSNDTVPAFQIPDTFEFNGTSGSFNRPPECIVERLELSSADYSPGVESTSEAYLITCKGFSPDYSETDKGTLKTGSVVWLQSTVQLNASASN